MKLPLRRFYLLGFPWKKPSWPDSVPRPHPRMHLGGNYDTSWARSPAARAVRSALVETATKAVVQAVAPPKIEGVDRIAHIGDAAIFAANHASHLDTSVLVTSLPRRYRHKVVVAAGADYFFDKRWKAAWWSLSMNIIPVERTRVTRKSADLAAQLLENGWSLLIYPEGGRTPDGWIRPFRGGAAYLSLRTGRPVVPMFVSGTRHVLGKGSRRLRPGSTTVIFGSPMLPREGEDAREFNERIEVAVHALADEHSNDWWSARRRAAGGETPILHGPDGPDWRRRWAASGGRARRTRLTWPKR